MRIAIYGNNLNVGYFFTKAFRQQNIEAYLLLYELPYSQEQHFWWSDEVKHDEWIIPIKHPGEFLWLSPNLKGLPSISHLYKLVKDFDAILVMVDGPAVFSEFEACPQIFISVGYDLQVLPFAIEAYLKPNLLRQRFLRDLKTGNFYDLGILFVDLFRYPRLQARQRKGLAQSAAWICYNGSQKTFVKALGYDEKQVFYYPIPMDMDDYLEKTDVDLRDELQDKYKDYDLVFLHPTRQFFLALDGNVYLKDNDKLIKAYAQFVQRTNKKTCLILFEKGRDLAAAKQLVKDLGLEVEWLPETPNKQLRSYYQLSQVVVCDQFAENLSGGNIFREASYYGCPILSNFPAEHYQALYREDIPPHVFHANTVETILEGMLALETWQAETRENCRKEAQAWFHRYYPASQAISNYIAVIKSVVQSHSFSD